MLSDFDMMSLHGFILFYVSCLLSSMPTLASSLEFDKGSSRSLYVLGSSRSAVAMNKALQMLGYSPVISNISSAEGGSTSLKYENMMLAPNDTNLASRHLDYISILPCGIEESCDSDHSTQELLKYEVAHYRIESHANPIEGGSRTGYFRRVLKFDIHAATRSAQAEKWVDLCQVLGLGYSVLERLHLKQFPQ
jgi:hypothetical protein